MYIWLVKAGEAIPSDESRDRLRRMGSLAEQLTACGHKVCWFNSTFYHSRKIQRVNEDKEIQISENYTIQLIWANSYKRNISIARIKHHIYTAKRFRMLADKMEKPDVVLCSMPTIELAEAAVNYANENNVPVIVDLRDLWPDIFAEMVPKPIGIIIKPYIMHSQKRLSKLLKNADAITAFTDSFLEWGLKYAGRLKSINDRVFYMAYKLENNKKDDNDNGWVQFGIESDDFIVSFFGTIGKQFNFMPIIEAARELSDDKKVKFIICGDGESLEMIKGKTRYLNNIIYPGWLDKRKIQSLLHITSVGLAPYRESISFKMSLPNKFGEYLSAGLPVLLSINGEMEHMLSKYKCGFVYKDGKHLAEIIMRLKSDKKLFASMSDNASKLYDESFDTIKVYADMVKYLEDMSKIHK